MDGSKDAEVFEADLDGCAELCDFEPNCCLFKHRFLQQSCTLNIECNSNLGVDEDSKLCMKEGKTCFK